MKENSTIKTKKVLIMGLDKAGKTSIVLCLMGVKKLSSFSFPNPTRGLKINRFKALDSEFSIWDFGGQEKFREGYLDNFKNYIKESQKFIFVIDIQDQERLELSLDYLHQIVTILKKQDLNLEFSIFLHKYDPELEFNSEFNKIIPKLINKIKKRIPNDFSYHIYTTSIYTVFQKSAR